MIRYDFSVARTLAKTTGLALLKSDPPGAEITIGGVSYGATPKLLLYSVFCVLCSQRLYAVIHLHLTLHCSLFLFCFWYPYC